jgi:hypothetical protein
VTAWRAEREAAQEAQQAGAERMQGAGSPPRPAPPTKRSTASPSTVRRRLAQAERELAAATAARDAAAASLAGCGGDHGRLTELSHDLAEAQAAVDLAEEAWLALAAAAEDLGLDV